MDLNCVRHNENDRPNLSFAGERAAEHSNTITNFEIRHINSQRVSSCYPRPVLPRILRPMRLSRRSEPFDSDDYIFELKIDGFRALAHLSEGRGELISRNGKKEIVMKLLTQLAHYAEANCKDDMTIFVSSGFTAKSSIRNTTTPVSESIKKIAPGPDSGQILLSLMKYPGAASYEIRWAVGDVGVPGAWTSQAIGKIIKSPTTISGLKPGTTYAFQARAVKKAGGHSDYGDSVTRMVV